MPVTHDADYRLGANTTMQAAAVATEAMERGEEAYQFRFEWEEAAQYQREDGEDGETF